MGQDLTRTRELNMNTKLKYSKILQSFDWNRFAFAVSVTDIILTVSRCFCYDEVDHLVSPFYVPGTIDAFNQQYFMNFPHMLHRWGFSYAWYF